MVKGFWPLSWRNSAQIMARTISVAREVAILFLMKPLQACGQSLLLGSACWRVRRGLKGSEGSKAEGAQRGGMMSRFNAFSTSSGQREASRRGGTVSLHCGPLDGSNWLCRWGPFLDRAYLKALQLHLVRLETWQEHLCRCVARNLARTSSFHLPISVASINNPERKLSHRSVFAPPARVYLLLQCQMKVCP
jgi:hypothetical protein